MSKHNGSRRINLGKVALLISLPTLAIPVSAWVPPSADVKTSVSRASAAFLGRILALEEVEARPARTVAEARVEVLECYLGAGCRVGKTVRVRFLSRSFLEEVDPGFGIPTPFELSSTVLFVLASRTGFRGPMAFNVDIHRDGMDSAYVAADDPPSAQEWKAGAERTFVNVYWPKDRQGIRRSDLLTWAEARRGPTPP